MKEVRIDAATLIKYGLIGYIISKTIGSKFLLGCAVGYYIGKYGFPKQLPKISGVGENHQISVSGRLALPWRG